MAGEVEIRDSWRRIEAWVASNVPPLADALRPPATAAEVRQAESAIGVAFPPEFIASLAVHDGQDDSAFEVFGDWGLLNLASIERKWRLLADQADTGILHTFDEPRWIVAKGPVRPRAWDRAWIPVASMGTGAYLLLDLNPPEPGKPGQVISYASGSPTRAVVAPDFGAWLSDIAHQLESGTFTPVAGNSYLARKT